MHGEVCDCFQRGKGRVYKFKCFFQLPAVMSHALSLTVKVALMVFALSVQTCLVPNGRVNPLIFPPVSGGSA